MFLYKLVNFNHFQFSSKISYSTMSFLAVFLCTQEHHHPKWEKPWWSQGSFIYDVFLSAISRKVRRGGGAVGNL